MTRRTERPLMDVERVAVKKLNEGGMSAAAIATALFISRRQVKFVLAHQDDEQARVAMRRASIQAVQ